VENPFLESALSLLSPVPVMTSLPAASSEALGATIAPQRLRLINFLVTGSLFMENLDGSIIATALPQMAKSFGSNALELNLGISAYLLALGVFIPATGWVADRFGARRVFGTAIALFTITSVLCGSANSLGMFIALRILQGISGAMMVPVGRLVVLRWTPKPKLMAALQALVWPALVAPVIGPPLGGFITTHATWRWIFYLNVPLGLAAFIAAWRLVPDVRESVARRFDWIGFVLCGAGTFMLLIGMERLAANFDTVSWVEVVLGLGVLAMAIRHLRRADSPMLDLSPMGIATFRACMRGGSLTRMAIGAAPFLLPLMFQVGFGYSAFTSGLLVLAVFAGNLALKTVTTPILKRFGYRKVTLRNGVLCALGLAACGAITPGMPVALTVLILFISGLTRSMQFTVYGTLAFADVSKDRMSDANGLFNTINQVSMAAAVTLGSLCVRAGQALGPLPFLAGPGEPFRFAFILVGLFGAIGLIDFISLPKDAGQAFVQGKR
jgi:EmrB/QacA subfamily drug resistance transporter